MILCPFSTFALLKKIGNASSISAIANASVPTKIPANKPYRISNNTPNSPNPLSPTKCPYSDMNVPPKVPVTTKFSYSNMCFASCILPMYLGNNPTARRIVNTPDAASAPKDKPITASNILLLNLFYPTSFRILYNSLINISFIIMHCNRYRRWIRCKFLFSNMIEKHSNSDE